MNSPTTVRAISPFRDGVRILSFAISLVVLGLGSAVRVQAQATCLSGYSSGGAYLNFYNDFLIIEVGTQPASGCLSGTSEGTSHEYVETVGPLAPPHPEYVTNSSAVSAFGLGAFSAASDGVTVVGSGFAKLTKRRGYFNFFVPVEASGGGGGGGSLQIHTPVRVHASLSVSGNGSARATVGPLVLDRSQTSGSFIVRPPATLGVSALAQGYFDFDWDSSDTVFDVNSSVALTVKLIPTSVPQARLRALEVNQNIQDWTNSVPLIAGKRTFVRAFLETVNPSDAGKPVFGILRGFRNGLELPGSPLSAINYNGVGELRLNASDPVARADVGYSVNFELPPTWLSGNVQLSFEGQNLDLICGEPAEVGGLANDCRVNVTFRSAPRLSVKFMRVGYRDPATGIYHQPTEAEVDELVSQLPNYMPIDVVEYTVGELAVGPQHLANASLLLGALRDARVEDVLTNDAPSAYYFGLFTGPVTAFSNGRPVNGVAYRPGPVGCGRAEKTDTVAHELGHMLGRYHTVDHSLGTTTNGEWQGYCGERGDSTAPDFPYFYIGSAGDTFPTLGPMSDGPNAVVYGVAPYPDPYDRLQAQNPSSCADLMSYCFSYDRKPSKFTYEGMLAALELLNLRPATEPAPGPKEGAGGEDDYLLVRGVVNLESGQMSWLPFRCLSLTQPPAAPPTGPYTLEMLDAGGDVVSSVSFGLTVAEDMAEAIATFSLPMPITTSVRQARLKKNSTVLGLRVASMNQPAVQLVSPNGGEALTNDAVSVAWQVADADGDTLAFNVAYSPDGGGNWNTLAVDIQTNVLVVLRSSLKASTNGFFRVSVSDGFWCGEDISDAAFTVANNRPRISMRSPVDGAKYFGSQKLIMQVAVYDSEQGNRSVTNVVWRSDRKGFLGSGLSLSVGTEALAAGLHRVSATAIDGNGLSVSITNTIEVLAFPLPRLRALAPPASGTMPLELAGTPDTLLTLETSTNLMNWSPLTSFTLSNFFLTVPVPAPGAEPARFYRTRLGGLPPLPPTLLTQPPASVSVTNGQTFALSGVASGAGPISYQWYFNGFALPGETNALLAFPNSRVNQAGNYYLVAVNAAGAITSTVSTVSVSGASYQVIHWFGTNSLDGTNGWGPLALDTNSWLYGCARNGGISNAGVVFKMQTNGANFSVLHRFQSATDGATPLGGLILASDGRLYGTCTGGGTNNSGTVFRLDRDGNNFTVLHHFLSFGDCRNPQAELLEGSDGRLYGTTYSGGGFGPGGVFRLNKDGSGYQVLYGFRTTGNDGQGPLGGLIEALDGFLYGTTEFGGQSNRGTIFRVAKAGTNYLRIKDLGIVAGGAVSPQCTLLQVADGTLYGTTYSGGLSNLGTVFAVATNGATFITPHNFVGGEGNEPRAGLVPAPDGSLLGTTRVGGLANQGVIYKVSTNSPGVYQTVHDFTGLAGDGARSRSPLLRAGGGVYYGMTFGGGTNDQGTIFRLSLP